MTMARTAPPDVIFCWSFAPHDVVYLFRRVDFPAVAGNNSQMVDYFATVFHVSIIVLEINKNISKGAESRIKELKGRYNEVRAKAKEKRPREDTK